MDRTPTPPPTGPAGTEPGRGHRSDFIAPSRSFATLTKTSRESLTLALLARSRAPTATVEEYRRAGTHDRRGVGRNA
jgi:hypothetical protein